MIHHQIIVEDSIVTIEVVGPLTDDDFTELTAAVDGFLTTHSSIRGLLIHTKEFPGWDDLDGMIEHIKFVKDHHRKIKKVAMVSDSKLAPVIPRIAGHFISAKIKHFHFDEYNTAVNWLSEAE